MSDSSIEVFIPYETIGEKYELDSQKSGVWSKLILIHAVVAKEILTNSSTKKTI